MKNFVKISNISNWVSIDENMILFKGKLSLKQYNPMKPIKRDYKLWYMGDMDSSLFQLDVEDNALLIDSYMANHFGLGEKWCTEWLNHFMEKITKSIVINTSHRCLSLNMLYPRRFTFVTQYKVIKSSSRRFEGQQTIRKREIWLRQRRYWHSFLEVEAQ